MVQKMRAMQASKPGGPFELVEREVPAPGAGQVRLRVEACGICHSDALVREGYWPGIPYPRVPGHEVIGTVEALGEGVRGWSTGERVGVGWHGGHCFVCDPCRRGDFNMCKSAKISGISHDGGYADYMIAPAESLARVPRDIPAAQAGPLLCAGLTVFNALRNSPARAGDLVAVQGIGGLGHLAVQFAARMGFRTVAISRGADKREFAHKLGASAYIDTNTENLGERLQSLGGARVALATAPSGEAISALVLGLGVDGQVLIAAAPHDPVQVSPVALLSGRRSVRGWFSGQAMDAEDTIAFAAQAGVQAMVETFPLAQANEAYQRMITNQARFRVVLTMT